jgi:Fe-S cluster assembly scaffold protein SufB
MLITILWWIMYSRDVLSNEMYKGVINDQATAVFNGKIYVRQAAQKTKCIPVE